VEPHDEEGRHARVLPTEGLRHPEVSSAAQEDAPQGLAVSDLLPHLLSLAAVTNDAASEPTSGIDDFLIAEYQHFADSFWRTEELGEKRLNFFISLLTAAVAGLILLATKDSGFSDSEVQWISFGTGLALLLLGFSTLLRMLRRNNVADQYKDAMSLVRASFVTRHGLEGYQPFAKLPRKLFTGGLAQTAALLNSMIAGALMALGLLFTTSPKRIGLAAALVFVLSLAIQFLYIGMRHKRR
jgi:hypothetical protein